MFRYGMDIEGHSTMALRQSKQNAKRRYCSTVKVMMFVLVKQLTSVKWLFDYSRHV